MLYTSFHIHNAGTPDEHTHTYTLDPWPGRNVNLLIPTDAAVDATVMEDLLSAFDAGYDYYHRITGRHPLDREGSTIDGRTTIAIVDDTCGSGCGWLGERGIEIEPDFFGSNLEGEHPWVRGFYDAMAESQTVTSIVFYELGRNFWFYGEQLGGLEPKTDYGFATGFAVVNRYYAGRVSGFTWDEQESAADYHNQSLPVIAQTYFADETATGLTTLGNNQGIANPTGINGSADLAASLFRILHVIGPSWVVWFES